LLLPTADLPLSVCIITKNEQEKLPDCLKSVEWASEVILVDDFSEDDTPKISRSFANVHYHARRMEGFGFQKAHAVNLATHDWILNIDADERMSPELQTEIGRAITSAQDESGFRVRLQHFWFGTSQVDSYPGGLRLFRKSRGNFGPYFVHEKVDIDGPVGQLQEFLLHYPKSGENFENYYQKYVLRYSPLAARDYLARGRRVTVLNFLWRLALIPALVFVRDYLVKMKIRQGKIGLYVCVCAALSYQRSNWQLLRLQSREKKGAAVEG
jgi:glycosyltransferase involved in cell wall biosynthesis